MPTKVPTKVRTDRRLKLRATFAGEDLRSREADSRQSPSGGFRARTNRGWATLLLGRLRDFVVAPSSAGFIGTSGHRQMMMNPSVVNLQHRSVLELSVGLSFDQRQAPWGTGLFWRQLQALSALPCRSLARNLHSSGYTQTICSQGGGPCEGFEKRWRTTTISVRGV